MGKQFRFPSRGKVDLPRGYDAKIGKGWLAIAESLLFGESAAGINLIQRDGWRGSYVNPPASFDPVGAPQTVTVTRPGFDASANPTTVSDTLTIMKRVRQAFPTQTSLNQSDVALSDYVYFGDTISGIVNASALVAPVPICMHLQADLHRAVGQVFTPRLAVSHMYARNGRPVAAVKFIVTDGTTTVEALVSTMSKITYSASGLSVAEFEPPPMDLSPLTPNGLCIYDVEVYPWVGAMYKASVHGAAYPSSNFTTQRVLPDNGSYGTAYAYVDATLGNNGTAITSATPAAAAALPYATVAGAAAGIKVFNNTNYSRNNTAGGIVRLVAGTYTHADFSASTSGPIPLVIEASVPANKATTIYRDAGASTGGGTPNAVKFKDLTIKRNASGDVIFLDNGGASSSVVFDGCTFDDSGFGASWGAYIYQVAFVWVINCDGDDLGFGTAFSSDKKGINAVGSTHSLGTATYNAAGCKNLDVALSDGSFGVGSREQTLGRFLGFNFFGGSGPPIITHFSQIGPAGFTLCGTTLEYRSGIGPIAQIGESTSADQNILLHGCTFVGQRLNFAYNDTSGALKRASVKFCVFDEYNSKGDVFASNGTYVGNWPVLYHVGYRSNAMTYGDSNTDAFGVGSWAGEVGAFGDVIGTNASPIVVDWVSDRSSRGTAAGDGDYTPGAGTALPFIPAGQSLYAWDLYGNAISDSGASRIGARMAAASGVNGVASGSIAFTGTSAAAVLVKGIATGSIAFTGTAQAVARIAATCAGTLPLTGAATGTVGSVAINGAASGAIDLSGASSGQVLARAQTTGALPISGASVGDIDVAAVATGSISLSGAAAGAVSIAALGVGSLPLSGVSTGAVRVVANSIGDLPLTGSAAGAIGNVPVTGVADGTLPLTGIAAGSVLASGQAVGALPLSGGGAAAALIAAIASGDLPLSGASLAAAGSGALAQGTLPLSGLAAAKVGVFATVAGTLIITGSSDAMVLLKAIAAGVLPVSGTAAGQQGALITEGFMSGAPYRGGNFINTSQRGGGFLDAVRGGTMAKGR